MFMDVDFHCLLSQVFYGFILCEVIKCYMSVQLTKSFFVSDFIEGVLCAVQVCHLKKDKVSIFFPC